MADQDSIGNNRVPLISDEGAQLGASIETSQLKRKLNRNTINLAKLSLVLKNKNKLNVSGSNQGMGESQRERINSIANILNETLSKLKKPNTHVLQPLDQTYTSQQQA